MFHFGIVNAICEERGFAWPNHHFRSRLDDGPMIAGTYPVQSGEEPLIPEAIAVTVALFVLLWLSSQLIIATQWQFSLKQARCFEVPDVSI